ncbi:MAG: sialidase family protein [Pirellulales bacterium]
MKLFLPLIIAISCFSRTIAAAAEPPKPVLVEVKRIWDQAPHNAFTDLIRFKDRWYCVFREGKSHISPDGALRVISSADGKKWESAALIESENSDLRDAKITVNPDGQLMLAGAETWDKPTTKFQSLVWFSTDGKRWSEKHEVGDRDNWLWRITWHKGTAYGVGYGCGSDNQCVRLFKSQDGKSFDTLIDKMAVEGTYPNESSMVFLPDDTCYCLLRQDGQPNSGYVGKSHPPYTEWNWKKLGVRIGGPHMIRLPNGRFVAVVRLYDSPVRTSVCWLDPEKGTLTEALKLPSGGDTSYAGMVWHDEMLWISYYSSHEAKTSIYLAKVKFENESSGK